MSLVNSYGNILKVIDASKNNITVEIYKDGDKLTNGLDQNFEKKVRTTFNVGTLFDEKLNEISADSNKTVGENVIYVAELTLVAIATDDPNKLVFNGIGGDWEIPTSPAS